MDVSLAKAKLAGLLQLQSITSDLQLANMEPDKPAPGVSRSRSEPGEGVMSEGCWALIPHPVLTRPTCQRVTPPLPRRRHQLQDPLVLVSLLCN